MTRLYLVFLLTITYLFIHGCKQDENEVRKFQLTVINGSGSGNYEKGSVIVIKANHYQDSIFKRWEGDTLEIENTRMDSLLLVMPAKDIVLRASYNQKILDVVNFDTLNIYTIYIDENNIKWLGTSNGIYYFDGESFYHQSKITNSPSNVINDLGFEDAGTLDKLWIATREGVGAWDISNLDAITSATPYTTANSGIVSNKVSCTTIDSSLVRWFGTNAGLSVFDNNQWINVSQILAFNHEVLDIVESPFGYMFVGTSSNGIARIGYNDVDGVTSASWWEQPWSAILSMRIQVIFVDSKDRQWFGTEEGVSLHTGSQAKGGWKDYTIDNGLVNNNILCITEDHEQNIWVGTLGGISVYDGSTWLNYTSSDGLPSDTIYCMAIDNKGTIWIGTEQSLVSYNGSNFDQYSN